MIQRLAILITSYNRVAKTLECLESFYKCKLPAEVETSIYMVDDKSPDGTGNIIKEKYPEINIVYGSGNLFWNRGMYLAWETASKAEYDYFLWLNDDTNLLPFALQELIDESKSLKDEAIIVGSTCSRKTGTISYGGFKFNEGLITLKNQIQECNYFNGNCVLIPQKVFRRVGNLDPLFHHAIGDFDYGLRAARLGIKSYVCKTFIGYCEEHETLPLWCLSSVSLKKRLVNLYSPLGNSHPYYYFRYEFRHFGIFTAIVHLLSIHIRLLFPRLWKQ